MAEKKFMDKVKYFMGFGYDDEDEEYEEDNRNEDYGSNRPQPSANSLYPTASSNNSQSSTMGSQASTKNNLVNINKGGNIKVVIYQPKAFEDTKQIVDNLKAKKPVILNIEQLDKETARKIFDFCSGALYGLDGHIQQISRGIFILAPSNVDVTGDLKGELESKGIFTWNANRE